MWGGLRGAVTIVLAMVAAGGEKQILNVPKSGQSSPSTGTIHHF